MTLFSAPADRRSHPGGALRRRAGAVADGGEMIRGMILRWLDSIERAPVITITPVVAWYDIWIGVFIDRPKRAIYILPLPCLGVKITWRWEDV